ncbi:restriction endonuclease subunit S [Burkholderia vietnamiensis]|jgi:type I restriction enzyme S subunit|uniref:restriction endonuclease subunit S n=1 Tax=Burkholderia vietnamiensis TaxID=60552 RepID=UPI00104175E3|nr:restriction endonuclease subunit S [Burkholderia vietnamiensis]
MELKSGYKQTEVGVIPSDWVVKSLGELGRFKNGINKSAEDFGYGYPLVNLLDVFGVSKLKANGSDFGLVNSNDSERRAYELKRGDVLFVRSSVKPEGVGLTTLIHDDLPDAVFSGFLLRFRDGGELVTEYKEHCFFQEGFRRSLIANSTVSANTNVNQNALKKLYIWFPPEKSEQSAIAEALSDVDALLSGLDKLIAKKRDLKQAAMQQLLTGKTRLPGFSGEWEVNRFGEFVSIRNQKVMPTQVEPETLCVELEHVGQGDGRLLARGGASSSSASKYRFRAGDVLFGRLRSYLRKYWCASEDGICTTEIWPLMFDKERVSAGFVFALVQTDNFIEAASVSYGTHMPRADWGVIRNFEVALPSIEEQAAVAEVLSDMDAELAALEARREKTRLLKQGMMQELLTGKTRLV